MPRHPKLGSGLRHPWKCLRHRWQGTGLNPGPESLASEGPNHGGKLRRAVGMLVSVGGRVGSDDCMRQGRVVGCAAAGPW